MSTRLPALLTALRTRLDSVSTLPAARAWANSEFVPVTDTPYVSDSLDVADLRAIELGPTAHAQTAALYTARVHVPAGTGQLAALGHASAIVDAFRQHDPPMTVEGATVEVTEARAEPPQGFEGWYVVPVSVFLQFTHA